MSSIELVSEERAPVRNDLSAIFVSLERTALPLWLARLSRMTTPKRGISS